MRVNIRRKFSQKNALLQEHETRLRNLIVDDRTNIFSSLQSVTENSDTYEDITAETSVSEWVKEIYRDACLQKVKEGQLENSLFCPNLSEELQQFITFLPLW